MELDRGRNILGLRARARHAHRDELTDLTYLSRGQHQLLGNLKSRQSRDRADRLDAVEIGGGENAILILRRDRYAANPGMRKRAADKRDILQARKTDVGDELAAAAHQAVILLAQVARAYSLFRHANPQSSRDFRPSHSSRSGRNQIAPPSRLPRFAPGKADGLKTVALLLVAHRTSLQKVDLQLDALAAIDDVTEIGRASCRERV